MNFHLRRYWQNWSFQMKKLPVLYSYDLSTFYGSIISPSRPWTLCCHLVLSPGLLVLSYVRKCRLPLIIKYYYYCILAYREWSRRVPGTKRE